MLLGHFHDSITSLAELKDFLQMIVGNSHTSWWDSAGTAAASSWNTGARCCIWNSIHRSFQQFLSNLQVCMTERERKANKWDGSESKRRGISLGQSTAWKVFGSTNADQVLQCAAVLRKTAFCMFPVSIRKRKLHETMSVFFLLPQITDGMLGFGSVLKGKEQPHCMGRLLQDRGWVWSELMGVGKLVK